MHDMPAAALNAKAIPIGQMRRIWATSFCALDIRGAKPRHTRFTFSGIEGVVFHWIRISESFSRNRLTVFTMSDARMVWKNKLDSMVRFVDAAHGSTRYCRLLHRCLSTARYHA